MLSRRNVIKIFIFSVVLAFVLFLGNSVLFSHGVSFDPTLDWEKVNSMPYSQAAAYIAAHSKPTARWETLSVQVQWLTFIRPAFFALIGTLFAGGLTLVWWVRK